MAASGELAMTRISGTATVALVACLGYPASGAGNAGAATIVETQNFSYVVDASMTEAHPATEFLSVSINSTPA
jgi:hypothetical protein